MTAWRVAGPASLLLLCPGCVAPTVVLSAGASVLQAGATSFINGELESAQITTVDCVYQAAHEALIALQFEIISDRKGPDSASIHAHEMHGRSITISLSAKSPTVTKTNIRVGLMGDQVISRLILGEIQARCPALPAPEETPKP